MLKVLIINQQKTHRIPKKNIEIYLKKIILQFKIKKILNIKEKPLSINLVFLSEREMRILNYNFRKKNKPTDILSFSSTDPELFGELILCPEVIIKNAKSNNWSQKYEYLYMLIHGMLHLLGYDHENDSDAKKMFKLQDMIYNTVSDSPIKLDSNL